MRLSWWAQESLNQALSGVFPKLLLRNEFDPRTLRANMVEKVVAAATEHCRLVATFTEFKPELITIYQGTLLSVLFLPALEATQNHISRKILTQKANRKVVSTEAFTSTQKTAKKLTSTYR